MLLMVEKSMRGGMYHGVPWYGKANNKYKKHCDANTEPLYVMNCNANSGRIHKNCLWIVSNGGKTS